MSLVTPRKGYKSVPWLFGKEIEIPVEWEYGRIEHFCNKITSGGTPNRDNSEYYGGQIPWIKSGELKNNFLSESEEKISEKGLSESSAKLFPKNTLLIAMYGVTIGKTAILEKEATTNQAICAILPNTNFDSFYLQQLLISMKNILISFGMGAGQPNINQEIIKTLHIPLPPLPEQQKIATILSNVDNLIESTGKVIAHSKKVKKGLMQKLLTRGIGHTKFKKVQLFPRFKDEEIPLLWNLDNVENLIKIIDYRGRTPPFSDQGIPHLRSNNIRHEKINLNNLAYVSETTYDEYMTRGIPKKNDILFTTEGPLGEVAEVPENFKFSLAQRIIVLRSKNKKLFNGFLIYLLQDRKVKTRYEGLSTGSTLGGIASKWFTRLLLPYPECYEEQQKIATILSNIDSKITSQEQYKEKLEKLKKSLMQKLLTGEVRV